MSAMLSHNEIPLTIHRANRWMTTISWGLIFVGVVPTLVKVLLSAALRGNLGEDPWAIVFIGADYSDISLTALSLLIYALLFPLTLWVLWIAPRLKAIIVDRSDKGPRIAHRAKLAATLLTLSYTIYLLTNTAFLTLDFLWTKKLHGSSEDTPFNFGDFGVVVAANGVAVVLCWMMRQRIVRVSRQMT